MRNDFPTRGFLSAQAQAGVPTIRQANTDWFELAENVNLVLMRTIRVAVDSPAAQTHRWTREAVAVALLMRSTETFQAIMLLAERGMVVQARTLVRNVVEDSFVAGALTTQPETVIQMLKDGEEANTRFQADFIVAQRLGNSQEDLDRLEKTIETMDARRRFVKPKKVASLGGMLPQYLNYMRLSNDSAHTSALSLGKYFSTNPDGETWSYAMGPAASGDVQSTLHRAVLAVMPMPIVVAQLMPDPENNAALDKLGRRFQELPTGTTI